MTKCFEQPLSRLVLFNLLILYDTCLYPHERIHSNDSQNHFYSCRWQIFQSLLLFAQIYRLTHSYSSISPTHLPTYLPTHLNSLKIIRLQKMSHIRDLPLLNLRMPMMLQMPLRIWMEVNYKIRH
jgi:hypothetical protein